MDERDASRQCRSSNDSGTTKQVIMMAVRQTPSRLSISSPGFRILAFESIAVHVGNIDGRFRCAEVDKIPRAVVSQDWLRIGIFVHNDR